MLVDPFVDLFWHLGFATKFEGLGSLEGLDRLFGG